MRDSRPGLCRERPDGFSPTTAPPACSACGDASAPAADTVGCCCCCSAASAAAASSEGHTSSVAPSAPAVMDTGGGCSGVPAEVNRQAAAREQQQQQQQKPVSTLHLTQLNQPALWLLACANEHNDPMPAHAWPPPGAALRSAPLLPTQPHTPGPPPFHPPGALCRSSPLSTSQNQGRMDWCWWRPALAIQREMSAVPGCAVMQSSATLTCRV